MKTTHNLKFVMYVLTLFLVMQLITAHGDGGRAELLVDNYLIEMIYSEKPLTTNEPVLFIISLKESITSKPINFTNMQLFLSDNEKTLISTSLIPEFNGRVSFTYRFPYEDDFSIKVKFFNGLETIVETEFIIDEFILNEKRNSKEKELNIDKNEVIEVLISDEGFKPKQITISKETIIIWKNVGNNFHWPASDFHPTHKEYPTKKQGCLGSNFDACEGLERDETYSFTFDKLGSWSVHDHLYPGLTMHIKVVEEVKKKSSSFFLPFELILDLFNTKKNVENVIEITPDKFLQLPVPEQRNYLETLSAGESEEAWKYLKDAFIVNGQVIGNAHELAHIVGNAIYKQHDIKGILVCDPAFGFGCYHGVTEKVLTESGVNKIGEIESQCMSIFPSSIGGEAPSCIHGIGHGLLTMNGLDINKSLNDCGLLLENNRYYCYDGVFMENLFSLGTTVVDPKNPWEFCTAFDEKYHSSCSTYHITQILSHFKGNISALADACQASPSTIIYESCYRSLGFRVSQISHGNLQIIQQLCSEVDNKQNRDTCIIFAAVETIFQEFSGWKQTYKSLCNSLTGNAAQDCLSQSKQIIKNYNKDDSDSSTSQILTTSIPVSTKSSKAESSEIKEIKKLHEVSQRTEIYLRLMDRVGPEQAQEELYRSGLPFTGETHLLNHASGKFLYEKFGTSGLIQCKDYFLSSCYHGFTIELIAEEGLSGVNKVLEECQKVGITTLSQCMHSIGHGFVSWVGYKQLPQALELCDEVGSQFLNAPVFNCYDGVFMENVWGVHDGYPSPDRWIDNDDPLYPCYDSRIDQKYRLGCLANTATLMLKTFNGNLTKSGEVCFSIADSQERRGCFNNLARQIHPMSFGQVDKVYELCGYMPEEWINFCLTDVAISDISVGGRELAFEICNKIDKDKSDECYNRVLGTLYAYVPDPLEFRNVCSNIQDSKGQQKCIDRDIFRSR